MDNKRKDILKKGINVTLYPLPFRKGGKIANAGLGDKSVKPGIENKAGGTQAFNDGGKPKSTAGASVPAKPGAMDFLKSAFSSGARDEYRYARKANKAAEGKGPQSFRTASDFQLPSGQMAGKGSNVNITPKTTTMMKPPGISSQSAPVTPSPMAGLPPEMQTLMQQVLNTQRFQQSKGEDVQMQAQMGAQKTYNPPATPVTTTEVNASVGVGGRGRNPGKSMTPTVSWLSEHRSRREKGH